MGKKIGAFYDPNMKEEHWIDSDLIEKNIILSPQVVNTLNSDINRTINFKLRYEKEVNEIFLSASLKYDDENIKSYEVSVDAEKFAKALISAINSGDEDRFVDEEAVIKEAKNAAVDDIVTKLMEQGTLLTNITLNGIGFIKVKKDKVIVIDEVYIEKNNSNIELTLKNCSGIVQLENLPDPTMEFYSNNITIGTNEFKILKSKEGRLKEYKISTADLKTFPEEMPEEFMSIERLDTSKKDNEEYVNNIINKRMELLDSNMDEDDSLEQMLEDIML